MVKLRRRYYREEGAAMLPIGLSLLDTDEDKERFDRLYRQYSRLMQYAASSILQDEFLAEDAVQMAFLKILAHMDNIEEIPHPRTKAYVMMVVENVAKRLYVERKRRESLSFEGLQHDWPDEADVERTALSEATMKEIALEMDKLPVLDKEILLLRYIHGFTNQEIARLLKVKEAAVRKRLERARKRLAARLETADDQME